MNGLSWLVYIAGVVDSINSLIGIFVVVGLISSVVSFIVFAGAAHDNDLDKLYAKFFIKYGIKRVFPTVIALAILACLIPDKKTIYIIAASEMGEKVYQQPGTQEVMSTLKDTIINELKKLQKN